jgi:hypothetical protein
LRGLFSAPDAASSSPDASREAAWLLCDHVCAGLRSPLGGGEDGAGPGSEALCLPGAADAIVASVAVGERSLPIGSATSRRCRNSIRVFIVLSRPASATSTKYRKSVTASSKAALRSSSSRLPCNWIVICCSAMIAIVSPLSNDLPKRCMPRCFSRSMSVGAWSIDSSSKREGGAARFCERLSLIFWMIVPPSR